MNNHFIPRPSYEEVISRILSCYLLIQQTKPNLVPRSLLNKAECKIWSNWICACDCLSGIWDRLKKSAGLKKSLKMAALLQDELIELSAKLPLTKCGYKVAQLKYQDQLIDWLLLLFFGNIKFKVVVCSNLHVIVTVRDQSRQSS